MSGWCVRVSGDVSIPNPFAKDYVRSDIAFSSKALLYVKLPMSGGIWMVSEWCLGVTWWCLEVSGWCVMVSGDVSIPNPFAKDYVRSDIAFSSNALLYTKNCHV